MSRGVRPPGPARGLSEPDGGFIAAVAPRRRNLSTSEAPRSGREGAALPRSRRTSPASAHLRCLDGVGSRTASHLSHRRPRTSSQPCRSDGTDAVGCRGASRRSAPGLEASHRAVRRLADGHSRSESPAIGSRWPSRLGHGCAARAPRTSADGEQPRPGFEARPRTGLSDQPSATGGGELLTSLGQPLRMATDVGPRAVAAGQPASHRRDRELRRLHPRQLVPRDRRRHRRARRGRGRRTPGPRSGRRRCGRCRRRPGRRAWPCAARG